MALSTRSRKMNAQEKKEHLLEEAEQIVVLAVDVSAHFDGRLQLEQDGLRHEHVPRVDAQVFDFVLRQLDLFLKGGVEFVGCWGCRCLRYECRGVRKKIGKETARRANWGKIKKLATKNLFLENGLREVYIDKQAPALRHASIMCMRTNLFAGPGPSHPEEFFDDRVDGNSITRGRHGE
jgi:hypothetical protein